jgi:stage II sporulation protein D
MKTREQTMERHAAFFIALLLLILLLPAAIVLPHGESARSNVDRSGRQSLQMDTASRADAAVTVNVDRTATGKQEKVVLERYLVGVVGSEMPAEFALPALEAQALAARTYIVARMQKGTDATVTDTVSNQVYHSPGELKKTWGKAYGRKMARIEKAIAATDGKIITYRGQPISPLFFSTSNGYTENARDYWSKDVPYLRSVPSPWDKQSPKYHNEKKIPVADVTRALDVRLPSSGAIGHVLRRTAGDRVAVYAIGAQTFTGRQIREKLQLSSSDFTLTRQGDVVVARTVGSGHGVGMSQYGAEGLAREGKSAAEIVAYFYRGTKIGTFDPHRGQTVKK